MHALRFAVTLGLSVTWGLVVAATAPAGEPPDEAVGATFAEILTRVHRRDPDSGAIRSVFAKEDAPPVMILQLHPESGTAERVPSGLIFEMHEDPNTGTVIVRLRTQTMNLDVYEMYRLKIDRNVRAELAKLALMKTLNAEKQTLRRTKEAAEIKRITGGRLRYGMSRVEVVTVWGPPNEPPPGPGYQQAGRFDLHYDGYLLGFYAGLNSIREIVPEPVATSSTKLR